MSQDAWIMALILVGMFVLLVWDRWPAWLVFMGTLTVTMSLGLAPIEDLLSGHLTPKLIREHFDNLWLLGGELIRQINMDEEIRDK